MITVEVDYAQLYLFILTVLGFYCWVGFSLVTAWASHSAFSCCRARLSGAQASAVAARAQQLRPWALEHSLSLTVQAAAACGILPKPGIAVSPALTDGLFTTEPTRKHLHARFSFVSSVRKLAGFGLASGTLHSFTYL